MDANDLKKAFDELEPLEPQSAWDEHRLRLREHVADDDIDAFLRWSTIQATMFVGDAPYIKQEYEELPVAWYDAIQEPEFGKPLYIPWVKFKTSGNLIHQAYHLKQWTDKAGVKIEDLSHIVEVGGGYGAMALLCGRLGLDGLYDSFDFIEFLLLQSFYLDNTLGDETELLYWPWTQDHIDVFKYEYDSVGLFIALFSLSEMPIEDRDKYLAIEADNYLIAYQPQWSGVNNQAFFAEFVESKPDYHWWDYPNPHFSNYRYLIGAKK